MSNHSSRSFSLSLIAALALGGLAGLGSVARAADPAPATGAPATPPPGPAKPAWAIACDADLNKLCANELKNGSDVRTCLVNHENDLSQPCKDAFLHKYKMQMACKDDIQKVCGGTTDPKAINQCFNEKQKELSEGCRNALHTYTQEKHAAEAKAAGQPAPEEKPAKATKKRGKKAAK